MTSKSRNSNEALLIQDHGVQSISIPLIITAVTIFKILLIPSYKSTDFDVHRNWLAITHHLPIDQWYFTSNNDTTVHTLDYPPSFAFFEYVLSNNPITKRLLEFGILNQNCLALLGDHENDVSVIGYSCVVFQRCTVILFDIVYWIGCYFICRSFRFTSDREEQEEEGKDDDYEKKLKMLSLRPKSKVAFILLITNPGMIILDHVHFQYNGMIIGILLGSIAMMLQSIDQNQKQQKRQNNARIKRYDLVGAILFAFLLTVKHMYLTLAPLYFFYLLRRFCFLSGRQKEQVKFSLSSLLLLGSFVVVTLISPFIPFIKYGAREQMVQILSRLFPWQRGLCHDYWAGNVWALYLSLEKAMKVTLRLFQNIAIGIDAGYSIYETISSWILPFPTISPPTAAIFLLVGLSPAFISAWSIGTITSRHSVQDRQEGLMHCFIFSALSSFMLAYHVHEKAIMTAVIPMTVLSVTRIQNARLFLRLSTVGHFGLLPLLYRRAELGMKVCLNGAYLVWSIYLLEGAAIKDSVNNERIEFGGKIQHVSLLTKCDKIGLLLMGCLLIFAEVLHPLLLQPVNILEFLPVMLISLWCACGLITCWLHSGRIMKSMCSPGARPTHKEQHK